MKKRLFLIASVAMAVTTQVWAADPELGGTQTVCQSSGFIYTNDLPSGYSAEWDLSGAGNAGTDYVLTGNLTDAAIQVVWKTVSNSRKMKTRDISGDGCIGPWKETIVTVNPKPVVDPTTSTLCSTGQGTTTIAAATTDDVYNQDLAAKDKNNYDITKWDIAYKTALPSGVTMTGATIPATGVTSKSVLAGMKFENTNSTAQDVVINVTPYIGDCVGEPYTITIHVLPKVTVPTVTYRSI